MKKKGNYGHPQSAETRKKLSEITKRKWQDKEYREKVSNAHKHELSDEWRENISWGMIGINRSEETRRKMSEAQQKIQKDEAVREKQSKSWKRQWDSLSKEEQLARLKIWIEAGHNATRSGVYLKPSSIELKVAEQLDEMGVKYIQQKHLYDKKNDKNYFVDFYIPSLHLVIECNGDYWHSFDERKKRDEMLKEYVERANRKIMFIWEHEIKDDWFWIGDYFEGGDANA